MPRASLKDVTMGIEAPQPIRTVGRCHSSSSAAAAILISAMPVSKPMAPEPCVPMNSTLQSAGMRARTNWWIADKT